LAEHLIEWLTNFPTGLGFALIMLILLLCGLGLPMPEEVPLIAITYLAYIEELNLPVAIISVIIGMVGGDAMLYAVGYRYGNRIFEIRPFKNLLTPKRMERANHYFQKWGSGVVFLARFMAGVRGTVFLTAGILRMPFKRFLLMDGLAAALAVPINMWIVLKLFQWYGDDGVSETLQVLKKTGRSLLIVAVLVVALIALWAYIRQGRRPAAKSAAPD
jgi:membrane protein DedA with SNARE-associated domain